MRNWWGSVANAAVFARAVARDRMAETAAHLVEHVLPEQPIRQWVLSFPYPLRFLFATRPEVLSHVLVSSTGRSPPSSSAAPDCAWAPYPSPHLTIK